MERTFDAQSLVSLPRLDAASAVALGRGLATAAEGRKKLPKPIADALKKVVRTTGTVEESMGGRGAAADATGSQARAADVAEDNAWAALAEFLSAWSRLPEAIAGSRQARDAQAKLFADGLKFTQIAFKLEWAEAESRISQMPKNGVHAALKSIGGGPFLDNLTAAHDAYGKALGITATKAPAQATIALRDALDAFASACRSYALKVAASAEDDDPKSQELAAALLEPLTSWESKQAQAAANPATTQGNPPAAGTDPAPAK